MRLIPYITIVFFITAGCSAAEKEYYFFSSKDNGSVRRAVGTGWGSDILSVMEETVERRRAHALEIPVEGGGHIHNFHCPVHNTRLVFDWDKPGSHYCVPCGEYWEGNPKFDQAWIHILHDENAKYLEACTYLYMAKGDKKYCGMIIRMLEDLAAKYPAMNIHDREGRQVERYGGKMYSQSLDEAVWACTAARAFSVAEPSMSGEEKEFIREGFFRPCLELMARQEATNNWQVWHNAAIASIGVVLEDDEVIHMALDREWYGYHDMVRENVYDDGWWNEGSVGYHFYPLRAMLLTAEAVRCRDIDLYDGTLHKMFSAPVDLLYPDLSFPSQNDVAHGMRLSDHAGLYELAALRTGDKQFEKLLRLCYRGLSRTSANALVNGRDYGDATEPLELGSHVFDEMGVALLRGNGRTAVIKYGPHGGVHGHPDKLSISIHDGVCELLPDLGTTAYGVPDCRQWYQKTIAHNTVTVDGVDQLPAEGVLSGFDTVDGVSTVSARCDGAYPGVTMCRSLTLDGDMLEDTFTCTSGEEHTYDYVLLLHDRVLPAGSPHETGYQRIWDGSTRTFHQSFSFGYKSATVEISCPGSFEVITGTAPGIPPSGTAAGTECHPLIIRTRGKDMQVTAKWNFEN